MIVNVYLQSSNAPFVVDLELPAGATVGEILRALALVPAVTGENLSEITGAQLAELLIDVSGLRRYTSAYLGVPTQGVRNVKLEAGMATATKKGEELTILIAAPGVQ